MGLTDQVEQRVLFTNCDRLAAWSSNAAVSMHHWERSRKTDRKTWPPFARGSKGRHCHATKESSSPSDGSARQPSIRLTITNRVTALMACGTGKTLVALWVAERRSAQSILVLVPSLALFRQTLHEWARETSGQPFSHPAYAPIQP